MDDKQRRLVREYAGDAFDLLDDLAFDIDDRVVVDKLTDARNKLNICIAILDDREARR